MAKIGDKEAQRRALREAGTATKRDSAKIIAGLRDALAHAEGVPSGVSETKFDRNAYQREYMRKRRAAGKARRKPPQP